MNSFDWTTAASILTGFGGEPVTLHVPKTGLPFFDTVRLYGAIELYIGLREDVSIHDAGDKWIIEGVTRRQRLAGRDEAAFKELWTNKKPSSSEYCDCVRKTIMSGQWPSDIYFLDELGGKYDAVLQAGIRGLAAKNYDTLQSGQTSKKECKASIPLFQGLLAFAGMKRVESVGEIIFLPVFEGHVDLSKVVSPLSAWLGTPNPLCAQALVLLALKTSLFAEGYQDRLTAVVFNTDFSGKRSDNYSGTIAIDSTAIGKMKSSSFISHVYQIFRRLVTRAWQGQSGKYQATPLAPSALDMAYWLMQPVEKHLMALITVQEAMYRDGLRQLFVSADYVKEVFEMSYKNWEGQHETVRRFARAVASGIYYARMTKEQKLEDQRKAWYDEVTMLRSAPSAKAFIERAMILIEQGHREHSHVGTTHWDQAFDPQALFNSIGDNRNSFESFRELFRMYLVQESTYQSKEQYTEETSGEAVPAVGRTGG